MLVQQKKLKKKVIYRLLERYSSNKLLNLVSGFQPYLAISNKKSSDELTLYYIVCITCISVNTLQKILPKYEKFQKKKTELQKRTSTPLIFVHVIKILFSMSLLTPAL